MCVQDTPTRVTLRLLVAKTAQFGLNRASIDRHRLGILFVCTATDVFNYPSWLEGVEIIMLPSLSNFFKCEDGAVTVDWVVLTAAVVGLAVAAYATINSGSSNLTSKTDTTLSGFTVGDVSISE